MRTIVVWKQLQYSDRIMCRLRENHSGMETPSFPGSLPLPPGCVRTIVVWKRMTSKRKALSNLLRENHSGMETLISKTIVVAYIYVA